MPDLRDGALPHHGLVSDPRLTSALDSKAKALLAARAALDKQAGDVVVMDLRGLSTVSDFFVIGTAGSGRQIDAVREHIETALSQHGAKVWHIEGSASAGRATHPVHDEPQWVLMDCGEFVVHLFDQHARSFYRLEDLWRDAPRIPVTL